MAQPFVPLLTTNLKGWLSARGFWMVTVAALFPLVLTGAWVATHQGDVATQDLTWNVTGPITEGDAVEFTAVVQNTGGSSVGTFNASIAVGRVFGATLRPDATTTVEIDGLAPGERRTINLSWVAKPGVFFALADADSQDVIGEIDEFNNQEPKPIVVNYARPDPSAGPTAPENLTGGANATTEVALSVARVEMPENPKVGENVTIRAVAANAGPGEATNATLTVRVGRLFGATLVPFREQSENVVVPPGGEASVEVVWPAQEGAFWVEAFVRTGGEQLDADGADNHRAEPVVVNPEAADDLTPPEPPEKLTIKEFYIEILSLLHVRILIPFIALFYAAGVLSDERERGTLAYLLTRPVQRWIIPLTKFVASFAVASVAVSIGIVATFALLFGATPSGDIGFLTTPLLVSLLSLFAYGAFFILLGVVVDRPYLVGAAFVIGWETVAAIFVPWVRNLTISQHLLNAIGGWRLDQGVQVLPEGDSVRAVWVLLIAGVGFLAASAYVMRRREFDV